MQALTKRLAVLAITSIMGSAAMAQSEQDHQQHHPQGAAQSAQAQPAPAQPPASAPAQPQGQMPMGQMMQNMPEQCRAMMQNMPQGCMGMMQQMMQGGMMRGGMMQGQSGQAATKSEATKAYMAAMDAMHGPMMQALQDSDADAAFVKGMIPHHQGAIDMAKVVLQHGKDEQAKKWANDVIREQQREIAEMQEWLKKRGN